MINLQEKGAAKYSWWQDWRGECVAIVAGGPSANKVGVDLLRDRIHVVVINESYRLCPWAEILYACDDVWWHTRREKLKDFKGIRLAYNVKEAGIHCVAIAKDKASNLRHAMLYEEPGVIGAGGNSGFQALNLVTQFGATGVALIGFDYSEQGGVHWHGAYQPPLRNPDNGRFHEWRRHMTTAAPLLKRNGVDVVNCSLQSTIECFPKMTIEQMLKRWTL